MDQYTTNINDLPIDNNPPENRELPEKDIIHNEQRVNPNVNVEKKVTFQEKHNIPHIDKSTLYDLKESNKIIILASLLFLLFSDSKIKNYILNILIGIFGDNLKTTSGGVSKLGLVCYSTIYGLILYITLSIIDIILTKL
uniref:Uncharacterized protein n=1 Tax=viral metagenome TaxID=1070528 RepID=A0A6C0JIY3_9ZZZZ